VNDIDSASHATPNKRPAVPYRHPGSTPVAHVPCFVLFLVALAWRLWITFVTPQQAGWIWADALLWMAAAATCVAGLARWMPAQNALGAGMILAALAALVELVGQETGFPFGNFRHCGPGEDPASLGVFRALHNTPWPVFFCWVAILLSSRGVARVLLRPWRRFSHYGLWVIVLGSVLALWLAWGTEVFLHEVAKSKQWSLDGESPYTAPIPWTFYVAWWVTSFLALAFVAPWLILKPPVKAPTDMHPVLVWLLLATLLLAGCASRHSWPAAIGMAVALPLIGGISLRSRKAAVLVPPSER
jgi:hypothetical protein